MAFGKQVEARMSNFSLLNVQTSGEQLKANQSGKVKFKFNRVNVNLIWWPLLVSFSIESKQHWNKSNVSRTRKGLV
jgi:hypothetical protein